MPLSGSVTAATSATSVTLPQSNMTIVGLVVHSATTTGYISIPIDSTRSAIIPFKNPVALDVTTSAADYVPVQASFGDLQRVHFRVSGITLNFTATGLTGGTLVVYYGTPFPDSVPLQALAAIVVSYTTGTSLSFTFPGGPIRLAGIINVFGVDANPSVQTIRTITDTWNTSTGRTILLAFSVQDECNIRDIVPLGPDADGQMGLGAAQTLTITQAYVGTNVGTGYCIVYYVL